MEETLAPGPERPSERAHAEQTLRQLELAVNRTLDGLLHGDHRGLVPGAGTEAGEGRIYQPGDDVRRIDWNLTARTTVPHVRDTIAERELETWMVIDGSASIDFGTADCEKRDLALAAVAAFGFLAARGGSRLGAVLFDADGATVLPPRTGRDAVFALLRRLQVRDRAGAGEASLADALRRVRHVARRRGLVVVVSDLLDRSDWQRELRATASRHDVVVAELRDPRESTLPAVGLLTLVDPETGRRREVQTSSSKLRARFEEAARAQRERTIHDVRATGAAHLDLATDRPWLKDVVRFVTARRRRR
jgi:uncharacterized protein (DUF58 family)